MDKDKLTETIIGSAMVVSNALGNGFFEKVYENALAIELRKKGLLAEQQKHMSVVYNDTVVGEYAADILVNSQVILELKAARLIEKIHEAQLLNYLKASGLHTGLILNFGTPKLGIRRMVL